MTDTTTETTDATPERLLKSDSVIVEDGARHFNDDLLVRLAGKGQLYPDPAINLACKDAGERYYEDWYLSNMSTLGAVDYGKVGGAGGTGGLQLSERQEQKRKEYRKARAVLGAKYRPAVEMVLFQDMDLVRAGKQLTGASSPATCRAVAIERLTAGLLMLAKHYGFTSNR
jgi:hypothetical protein